MDGQEQGRTRGLRTRARLVRTRGVSDPRPSRPEGLPARLVRARQDSRRTRGVKTLPSRLEGLPGSAPRDQVPSDSATAGLLPLCPPCRAGYMCGPACRVKRYRFSFANKHLVYIYKTGLSSPCLPS